MNVIELTKTLIGIESITGNEGEVAKFLSDYLINLGWEVELQPIAPQRFNVIASQRSKARIFFSTHLDTVSPFVDATEDDTYIYGRGACDAKGIIAAQISAAEKLRKQGFAHLGLLFTADEEASSSGAKIANTHPIANECEFLINGEPTDNQLALFSKGSLRVFVQAKGVAAHSAYPEHGVSAIEILLKALDKIRNYNWPVDEVFGETTCNIGLISGGSATNVIAENASAGLHFRIITPASDVISTLKKLVEADITIEVVSQTEPVKLYSLQGFPNCIVRFTTDIPHLSNWGHPLLLGPGSIFAAHTINERVLKSELIEAVNLYEELALTLSRGFSQ